MSGIFINLTATEEDLREMRRYQQQKFYYNIFTNYNYLPSPIIDWDMVSRQKKGIELPKTIHNRQRLDIYQPEYANVDYGDYGILVK